jgi:catechol 2,3-dioxygenase-like lactoylglutathione lyase family enzyme
MADTETPLNPDQVRSGASASAGGRGRAATGMVHHIELWVPDLDRAITSFGWLLTEMGYRLYQDWPGGRSWGAGHTYIVVEQSPARTASRHDRCRPGLNHLAFHVASRREVDELTAEARLHGWRLMFADQHPYAGGPQHYAAYLENVDGFEVELVADLSVTPPRARPDPSRGCAAITPLARANRQRRRGHAHPGSTAAAGGRLT